MVAGSRNWSSPEQPSRARSAGRLLRVLIRCRSFNAATSEGRHGHVGDLGLESRVIAREPVMVVIRAETLTHTFWVQARSRSPHCASGDFLLPCVVSTVTLQRRFFVFFLKNVLHVCLLIYLCARAHHSLHVEVRDNLLESFLSFYYVDPGIKIRLSDFMASTPNCYPRNIVLISILQVEKQTKSFTWVIDLVTGSWCSCCLSNFVYTMMVY